MRPDNCPYFLVPVREGAETIHLPGYLTSFNETLLKDAKVKPGTNHWRKKFHNELQMLTKDKVKLQDLMTILDANGRKVQGKHYIMKDPDEDCVLAKALVRNVLGATVPWPTQAEADKACAAEGTADMIAEVAKLATDMEAHVQFVTDEDDPDDEPDQEWACGEIFGVLPVGELNLLPLGDNDADPPAAPIADAPAESAKRRKRKVCTEVLPQSPVSSKSLWKSEEYWSPPSIPGTSKQPDLDPDQSAWIMDRLREWQQEHAAGDVLAKPHGPGSNPWYWDLRVKAIDAGKLNKYHSQDICKNHIANKLRKAGAEAALSQVVD